MSGLSPKTLFVTIGSLQQRHYNILWQQFHLVRNLTDPPVLRGGVETSFASLGGGAFQTPAAWGTALWVVRKVLRGVRVPTSP